MTVCRFYLQGYCRNGNACKFEHPPKAGQQGFNNRFGALAGQTSQGMAGRAPDALEYPGLTVEAIQRDLANERPQWILSCYGPGRDAPEQLFGGYPREQSFEEIRWHFEQRAMAGNPQGALNDIQALYQNAQQVIQNALNNTPAAVQYILGAANKHPNRIDICKAAAGGGAFGGAAGAFQKPSAPANPFGAPAPAAPATGVGGFGQPAALGQKPSPFGAPAFGQPAQPAASPFGQPSTLGGTSAFGRPAQAPSAFGQTATLGAKPSPFGAPAFGQPAQPGGAPAFGQSGFGQAAALGPKPSPFGAPAAGASPFGAVSGAGGTTQAGPSPFGQLPQPAQKVNPFGQPATSSPFGQPAAAAPVNPFGRPQQQPAASPFGAPAAAPAPTTAFGQPVSATPFGAPPAAAAAAATTTAPTSTPFGQPSTSAPAAAAAAAGTPAQGPYGPGATRQHPDLSTYSSRAPDGSLRMFKGKPVTYETPKGGGGNAVPMTRNFDGSLVKIWSPNGPPNYTAETEAEPDKYEDPSVQQQWRTFLETGRFAGGVMPEVPPKREFCMWDF